MDFAAFSPQLALALDGARGDVVHSDPMRGFVPTPEHIVDLMVGRLFENRAPSPSSTILDPGCGPGAFIDGILRWCKRHKARVPRIVGVESEPRRHRAAVEKFRAHRSITVRREDFLRPSEAQFDYVIGNPPYVSILRLSERERAAYRATFDTARGRFDLYMLFFEQALRLLKPGGRLVFITPEKFLYVETARPLRKLLGSLDVREVRLLDEATFGSLTTYPTVTVIDKVPSRGRTRAFARDGAERTLTFPADGRSLLPRLNGARSDRDGGLTLADICRRISCGVATGADEVFVRDADELTAGLWPRAYPTISGRELAQPGEPASASRMLIPYDREGRLIGLDELGELATYLRRRSTELRARACARRKPWHAFHDSVPLAEILTPKLLCKDITAEPRFWIDRTGEIVPRHSVYYLVPRHPSQLDALAEYLRSEEPKRWLRANCQRAANGFLRLQSSVLKRLPVPASLAPRGFAA